MGLLQDAAGSVPHELKASRLSEGRSSRVLCSQGAAAVRLYGIIPYIPPILRDEELFQ